MDFITIDCGASFVKAARFNKSGELVKRAVNQSPFGKNQIGSLTSLVGDIFSELLQESDNTVCLCISNEMHGFLLAKNDGTPITDYISWQKEYGRIPLQTGSACEILSEYAQDVSNTGMPLRGGLPSVNLLYLRASGELDKISGDVYFYTLGDYILRALSEKQTETHLTNAAATGLVDLRTNDWNKKLLKVAAPSQIVFPKIGTEPVEFKFSGKRIIAFPAIGDQQAALYGANLRNDDELSFNMGTGGQVSRIIHSPALSTDYQVRPFLDGKYIKTIPHLPCGRALNVYFRFFRDVLRTFDAGKNDSDIWKNLLDAEEKSSDCGIDCDLSFFENAASPNVAGSIKNISEYSLTVGGLMKAVLNRLAENFFVESKKLSDSSDVQKILFSGGVARKIKSVRERIIDMCGVKNFEVAADETLKGLFLYGRKELAKI